MTEKSSLIVILYDLFTGVFEAVVGIVFLSLGQTAFIHYNQLLQQRLLENSYFLFATILEKAVPVLAEHNLFLSITLIITGIIKIISGIGLIYNQIWAEHLLVGFLVALIPFDCWSFIEGFSIYNIGYLLVHISIILYLVEFKPHHYAKRVYAHYKKKKQ